MSRARWLEWSDRVLCEDTMVTAIRGGERLALGHAQIPTAHASLIARRDMIASWHLKVTKKASIRGAIFVGIESFDGHPGDKPTVGSDWYQEDCRNAAFYYSSDGDLCQGDLVVKKTESSYGSGDILGIQMCDGILTFLKNGDPVGELRGLKEYNQVAVQLRRPGDQVKLIKELVDKAAQKDIQKRKEIEEKKREEYHAKLKREEELMRKREHERVLKIQKEEEERKQKELEERQRRELEEKQRRDAELNKLREAEEERARKEKQEEERRRVEDKRRAKLAREEAARKQAAEEQIRKVARSRGGYCEDDEDPDAPSNEEVQDFLNNCLPLRLLAAKQMGMVALPSLEETPFMKILLTPQQHHAIKKHLTQKKKNSSLERSSTAPDR
eukprot:520771-Hanusia_phi.AAC.1